MITISKTKDRINTMHTPIAITLVVMVQIICHNTHLAPVPAIDTTTMIDTN